MATAIVVLQAIDPVSGDCTFTMKRGAEATITAKVAGLPVNDPVSPVNTFVAAATLYAKNYYAGADAQAAKTPVVDPAVSALVGQSKTVTV